MQSTQAKNKLIIAAAGSGKTTRLVEKALKQKEGRVLITTYTQANKAEIRNKIIEKNKCIPKNVTIQTWFSFLLQHGVRPFQSSLFSCLDSERIQGLVLMNNISAPYSKEIELHHYFTKGLKIYSDKISKFIYRCNDRTNGDVIDRISRIYSHIFVDEVQDLAGYDLELLKLFFDSPSRILLVGDPRQGTYSTNSTSKYKKYKKTNIVNFFADEIDNLEKDDTSLMTNYRCNEAICSWSNKLFPNLPITSSGNKINDEHSGVFFIKKENIDDYLKKYKPLQLRNNRRTIINENYPVMNFGESKGLTFDRVLIYPTKPILNWIKDNNSDLAETSRSKLYVAFTRARHSVAIVCKENLEVNGIMNYNPTS